ncbi:unnamed protein product [Symbiodinium microadriaticum]|nr:unnamed protein product [Symbiodinium microadriaticum]CAE7875304.1 unnamed protein product [Symbiodinium sp. KB8]
MFYGDGKYPGDGGAVLEKLWQGHRWKELRNCPGRYTTSDSEARGKAPARLLDDLKILSATVEVVPEGKDRILVGRFSGGGGLLTYCKDGGVYVHTLNTESGLIRKIDALQLSSYAATLLAAEPMAANVAAFVVCLAVLPYLTDAEKNASTYALNQVLRDSAKWWQDGILRELDP